MIDQIGREIARRLDHHSDNVEPMFDFIINHTEIPQANALVKRGWLKSTGFTRQFRPTREFLSDVESSFYIQ